MVYIFHEDELPRLVSVVPGREQTSFVNKELTNIDDPLADAMHYKKGAASRYHLHPNCEHSYLIIERCRNSGNRRCHAQSPTGRLSFHTGRRYAPVAHDRHPAFFLRISGFQPFRDHHPGWNARRSALGTCGRPGLGSNIGVRF